MKKIFSINGVLNDEQNGEFATLNDMNYSLCCGNPPERELISIEEGIYMWQDSQQLKEIFKKDDTLDKWGFKDLEDCEGEYIKVMDNIKETESIRPTLYMELENDIDEMFEEVTKYVVDENDEVLQAVTRSTCNNMVYIYNYNRNENGETEKIVTSLNKSLLSGIFQYNGTYK